VERLYFFEIVEIALKVAFKILPSLDNLILGLSSVVIYIYIYIYIYIFHMPSHNIINFTTTPLE
jgi:hypothetical protein